jgi:arginyl-tRNA synthetase
VFQEIERRIAAAAERALVERFHLNRKVSLEQPKQTSFGELAIPVAFQLARDLKRSPKLIAEELVGAMGPVPGVKAFEIAGNGFINVRLDRGPYAQALLEPRKADAAEAKGGKTVVEHTNINPNKAAHIGHLRNAVLGDTFVRMLRESGRQVEVQNYIDNTGVQVADVVVGFHFLEKKNTEDVMDLIGGGSQSFDHFCWDLYAHVSSYYKDHPEALAWRAEALHAIESGIGEIAELAHLVADAIVRAHLATMARLGIQYDLLPRESEILHLQFWATAFELLKQRGAVHLETEGKNRGCWVMKASAFKMSGSKAEASDGEDAEQENIDDSKVIVRSNGTVTYVGKDIAYQLWKFGLLGKDFYYEPWGSYPDGHQVWVTTDEPQTGTVPKFGNAEQVYNVIDARQSYLQDVVVAGLEALGFPEQAAGSVHFSYAMVALSPRTCVEMGIELSEEDQRRPYVEVSGRRGLGVKADDLLNQLIHTAVVEVESRHADAPPDERRRVAEQIAVGALRYFMLKFTRNSVIAFDFHEALSFEGETGPYAQYAAVRAGNILRKYEERFGPIPDFKNLFSVDMLERQLEPEDLWQLLLACSKVDPVIARAISSGEPAHVAKYAFQLGQAFNNFYHEYQVINETDPARREFLLWLTVYFREQLAATLRILGIAQPAYM